jgi:hypothetical protein
MRKLITRKKRATTKDRVKPTIKARRPPKPKAPTQLDSANSRRRNFEAVFEELKKVMSAFESELRITASKPQEYSLATRANCWKGGPMFFVAVKIGKAYVSYHLFPLYVCPEMGKMVSASLKKRMQGKSCFNFRAPDRSLLAELSELTKAGVEKYSAKNWL